MTSRVSFLFLLAAVLCHAQDQPPAVAPTTPPPAPAPTRIGTIFAQNAIASTQEGRKASAALTAKFEPKKKQFDQKQTELTSLRDALKRGSATMSADAKAKLNQSIDAKSTELKRFSEDIQTQLEEEEGAMLQQIGDKLIKIIDTYARQNGFAVILDISAQQGPVLWGAPVLDITSEIIRLYDKENPVK